MATRLSALSVLFFTSTLFAMAATDPLAPFECKHRIVLAFDAEEATDTLTEAQAAIKERHILWFAVNSDRSRLQSNYDGELPANFGESLAARYREVPEGETEIVLIGKDGGVKSRDPALDLDTIFARIDSMPMRQAEMRHQ